MMSALQKNAHHCVIQFLELAEFGTSLVNKQIILRAKRERFFKRLNKIISTMYHMKRTCAYYKKEFEYLFFQDDKQNSSRFPG